MKTTDFESEARAILDQLTRFDAQERELATLRKSIVEREKAQQAAVLKAMETGAGAPAQANLSADRARIESLTALLPQFKARIEDRGRALKIAIYRAAEICVDEQRLVHDRKSIALKTRVLEALEILHSHLGTRKFRLFVNEQSLNASNNELRHDPFENVSMVALVVRKWEDARDTADGVLEILPSLKIEPSANVADAKKSARLTAAK